MKPQTFYQLVLVDPDNRDLLTINWVVYEAARFQFSCLIDAELNFTTKVELRKVVINEHEKPTKIVLAILENDANGNTVIIEKT